MRKNILVYISYLLIALSFVTAASVCRLGFDNCNITDLISYIFLYRENINDFLEPQRFLTIICPYLFSVYIIMISFYGMTKKYRSMIINRYYSRKKYFTTQLITITKKCLLVLTVNCAMLVIAAIIYGIELHDIQKTLPQTAFLLINQYLYFILIGFVNLYIVLKYKDENATIVCALITVSIPLLDAYEPAVAVLTYGSLEQLIRGTVLLFASVALMVTITRKYIYKSDIL